MEELEALKKEREEKVKQIAEKKKQVEELRRKRTQRQAQQQQLQQQAPQAPAPSDKKGDNASTVDALVAEILGGKAVEASALQTIAVPAGGDSGEAGGAAPQRAAQRGRGGGDRERKLQQEFKLLAQSLEPQEQEVYEKEVQTDLSGEQPEESTSSSTSKPQGTGKVARQASSVLDQAASQSRSRAVRPDVAGHTAGETTRSRTVQPTVNAPIKEEEQKDEEEKQKSLSKEEQDRIVAHPEFKAFFNRASLLVERTLGQQAWDVATDWKNVGGTEEDKGQETELMKHVEEYVEDRWSKGRPVTDVKFSPHNKEIFMAAYGQRVNAQDYDPDGCLLLWGSMKNRPELHFTSPSQVLTAQFHKFDPTLLYGGTYSGGILLWDTRANSTPVLRTPLSGKGHSHPVQALQQVGTQNATNLVSASNDGRICVWSLAMLKEPQDIPIDLKRDSKEKAQNRGDLAIMTLSFPENETNVLYAGAEDGSVCQVNLHGSTVGVTKMYDGHDGPVAGIDMHPRSSEAAKYGVEGTIDLALTCSFDWSIKLWMVKPYQSPVLTLDCFEDYVYDVKWHPTHPGCFASCDGEGHVALWNINQNTESPVVQCDSPNPRKLAFNQCAWSSCGQKLAAGDSEGTLSLYKVAPSISQPQPHDYQQFIERVKGFQPIAPRNKDPGYERFMVSGNYGRH